MVIVIPVIRVIDRTANPGMMLHVSVPELNENNVPVPGSLALHFNIDLAAVHANTLLADKLVVKFAGTILQDTVDYDIYKTFRTFSSREKSKTMWCPREHREKT